MPTKKNSKTTWAAFRKQLKGREPEARLSRLKDLHDSSSANRDFLQARVRAAAGNGCGAGEPTEFTEHRSHLGLIKAVAESPPVNRRPKANFPQS